MVGLKGHFHLGVVMEGYDMTRPVGFDDKGWGVDGRTGKRKCLAVDWPIASPPSPDDSGGKAKARKEDKWKPQPVKAGDIWTLTLDSDKGLFSPESMSFSWDLFLGMRWWQTGKCLQEH